MKRNKRSSDKIEEAAVGDKMILNSAEMWIKLQKKDNDGEKPVSEPLLTPRKLIAEEIQKAMEQGNVVFKKLEGEFRHLDVAMRYIGIVRDQRF